MNTVKRIVIVGPLPPPIGGVSIHIIRLTALLEKLGADISFIDESSNRKSGVFNLRSLNVIEYVKRIKRADIVHVHSGLYSLRIVNMLAAWVCQKEMLVTLHSWREKGSIFRWINTLMFRRATAVVCVSKRIAQAVNLVNVKIMPAFVPPNMPAESELSSSISAWLSEQRQKGRKILTSNAYRFDLYEDADIYGADLCIEAVRRLVKDCGLDLAFVFVVSSLTSGKEIFSQYVQRIKDYELEGNFLLIHETNMSFVKLVEQVDIVIRATNTDGDALSVREAIYLKKAVIASDVVERPAGTILFRSRSSEDLTRRIKETLSMTDVRDNAKEQNGYEKIEMFYKHLYGLNGSD